MFSQGDKQTLTCAKHAAGNLKLRVVSWNLAGQDAQLAKTASPDADVLCMQEMARRQPGWEVSDDGDLGDFFWVSHQDSMQWRPTGIGISLNIVESLIGKKKIPRGIAILAKIKDWGRVVICSVHAPTGVTCDEYLARVREATQLLGAKWQQYPCVVGIDVNEAVMWNDAEDGLQPHLGNTNFQETINTMSAVGLRPLPPLDDQLHLPTHYPRDSTRQGRQIDMVFCRHLRGSRVYIDEPRRHIINSDHAALIVDFFIARKARVWRSDSRARWVHSEIPQDTIIVDMDDVMDLAAQHTRPHNSTKYKDNDEVREALLQAKNTKSRQDWKIVHKKRRQARREWQKHRRMKALAGDWHAYRDVAREKNRKPGWWGSLLRDRSDEELTTEVKSHLEQKLYDESSRDWDDQLQRFIQAVPSDSSWIPFSLEEVGEALCQMKARSSVGPDLVGVDLLKYLSTHRELGPQLLQLLNFHCAHCLVPEVWDRSLLALLAKVEEPLRPKDLRPIAMSSSVQKLLNKLTMKRCFPYMRSPSSFSGCGKGRQSADVIGAISRLRDVTREWRLPVLLGKLDVKGAFDRIRRASVAEFIVRKTAHCGMNTEARWLLRQLATNKLVGWVPGGHNIEIDCNSGIKQGAPESAELFGLLIGDMIDGLLDDPRWANLAIPWGDVPLSVVYYQDDIFLWDESPDQIEKKIELIAEGLSRLGLELAEDKTLFIASHFYKGRRSLKIGGQQVAVQGADATMRVLGVNFNLTDPPGQQARDLLCRATEAAHVHGKILQEDGKWEDKVTMIRSLVEGTFTWSAGAVHWNREELTTANSIQIKTLRKAFRLRRRSDEDWLAWHTRTWRFVRAWMHTNHVLRWSTRILQLQFSLLGHWARQSEGQLNDGSARRGIAFRMMQWRSHSWWKHQQSLSVHLGKRHPGRFYPDCVERRISETVSLNWGDIACNRQEWFKQREAWLSAYDVRWSVGRQRALTC